MNYNEVFKCNICCLDYDQKIHRPMIICQNHHTICEVCLSDISKQSNSIFNCPICRTATKKEQAIYNKSFFIYRQEAEDLISFRNRIQAEKKQLKNKLIKLQEKWTTSNKDLNKQIKIVSKKQIQISQLKKKIDDCRIYQEKLNKYIDKLTEQNDKHQITNEKLKEEQKKFNEAYSFSTQQNSKLLQKLKETQSSFLKLQQKMTKQIQMKDQLNKNIQLQRKNHASKKQHYNQQTESFKIEKQRYLKQIESLKIEKKVENAILNPSKENKEIVSNEQQVQYYKNLCDFHIKNQNKLSNRIIKLQKKIKRLSLLEDRIQSYQRQQYYWEKRVFDLSQQIQTLYQQVQQKNLRANCNCEELKRILSRHKMDIQNLRRENQQYCQKIASLQHRCDKQTQIKALLIRTVDSLNQVNDQNQALIKQLKTKNDILTSKAAKLQEQLNPQSNQKGFFSNFFKK